MSELITTRPRADLRFQLLATVSALSLLTAAVTQAKAEEAERPTVWIELGGGLDRLGNKQETYTPPFVALTPPDFTPPQKAGKPPRYGLNETAALTFQPRNSDWIFSAALRYGRASSRKSVHHQTYPELYPTHGVVQLTTNPVPTIIQGSGVMPAGARFTDANVKQSESQAIVDFHAGKDVGVGLFGRNATSSLEVGVRFAQFTSKSQIGLRENPDWHFSVHNHTIVRPPNPRNGRPGRTTILQYVDQPFHSYAGSIETDRSFHGVGPSVSWQASLPFAGAEQSGELAFDWGMNAAVLFGRQKAREQHQTTGVSGYGTGPNYYHQKRIQISHYSTHHTRSRSVTVPNIGGFAGLSFRYDNAKVALGYRADFFFGAMDGGIDARKTYDRNSYGPFATVSIGLGG
jgi:hypothetical protein